MPETIGFRVPNDLAVLGGVLDRLEAYCAGLGMTPSQGRDIRLALDEILTNIIVHAWPEGGEHVAELNVSAEGGVLTFVVADDGVPFDPVAHPSPPQPDGIDMMPIGGLGLQLVRSIADALAYTRSGDRNRLEIKKRYRPA